MGVILYSDLDANILLGISMLHSLKHETLPNKLTSSIQFCLRFTISSELNGGRIETNKIWAVILKTLGDFNYSADWVNQFEGFEPMAK